MGHEVSIYVFFDSDLAGDKYTRRIQTGVLIFINKYPIHWYSKSQVNFKEINFGVEFYATNTGVEIVEDLI